jgi:hypothetical protein
VPRRALAHIYIYKENADALNESIVRARSEKFVIGSERVNSHCAFAAELSAQSVHTQQVHGQELNKLNMTRITSLAQSSRRARIQIQAPFRLVRDKR